MNLFLGSVNYAGVPADEKVVRTTATPVDHNAPAAMAPNAPDRNEVETDTNPTLGMVNRQLASTWHEPQKYPPSWGPSVSDSDQYNAIVDKQVSSSGTAAAREMTGQFGHGTIAFAEGIEPVADLVDGGAMTNTYFSAEKPAVNSVSGDYMSVPPGMDRAAVTATQAVGKSEARKAAMQSAYAAYLKSVVG